MTKYTGILLASGLLLSVAARAQNETDALRYGELSTGATARSISLGGTGGSFGGDFSSLSINPAGLGVYRSSEVMITPTLRLNNARSTYFKNDTKDNNARMGISNFGVVFSTAKKGKDYTKSDWKAFSIGLGYNRVADLNSAVTYTGTNDQSSITDIFSADALQNGIGQNLVPPLGFFGWEGYLLDTDYASIPRQQILNNGGGLLQSKSWESKGGIDEWSFSLGGNYKEKLLLGISLDLVSYKFDRNTNFWESDESGNANNDFDYLSYNEYLTTTGVGFNAKLGAIYVINDRFRIGAAFHTPTWSVFTDDFDYDLTTNTENLKNRTGQGDRDPETYVQPDQAYTFDYSLRSPWHALLSATAFFGQHGFITADYEYVDYASMKYDFGDPTTDYERGVNQAIKDTYTGGHNLRLGIEGRKDNFMGRLGFAYHSSPLQRSADFYGQRFDLSAGLGLRLNAFVIDLAYRYRIKKSSDFAYPFLASGVVTGIGDTRYGNSLLALTLGLKF
jgi:hypothetical protein